MTAREEINSWIEYNSKIKDDSERQLFYQKIRSILSNKTADEHRENLIALKDATKDLSKRVDASIKKSQLKVYPSSNEELELLTSLFSKMNIRFDIG